MGSLASRLRSGCHHVSNCWACELLESSADVDGVGDGGVVIPAREAEELEQALEASRREAEAAQEAEAVLTADRLVNDSLGYIERNIDEWHRQHRQQQQKQLTSEGVPQDVAIDRLVYLGIIFAVITTWRR